MWSLERETYKIKINEEKQKILQKEEQLNKIKKNLLKIRIDVSISTIAAFCTNILGGILLNPIINLCGLAFFLPTIFSSHKFFKFLDQEEKLIKEIQNCKESIKNYEKELKNFSTKETNQIIVTNAKNCEKSIKKSR